MRVISIQSQVVYATSATAAVQPMQAMGLEVRRCRPPCCPITSALSHHARPDLETELVADLLLGVEERDPPMTAGRWSRAIRGLPPMRRRRRASAALEGGTRRFWHTCDPVIGDDDLGVRRRGPDRTVPRRTDADGRHHHPNQFSNWADWFWRTARYGRGRDRGGPHPERARHAGRW